MSASCPASRATFWNRASAADEVVLREVGAFLEDDHRPPGLGELFRDDCSAGARADDDDVAVLDVVRVDVGKLDDLEARIGAEFAACAALAERVALVPQLDAGTRRPRRRSDLRSPGVTSQ